MTPTVESRLHNLVGKQGLLPVRGVGEISFAVVDVFPNDEFLGDIEQAINFSRFLVRFENGTLIDGKDTMTSYGLHFSHLNDGDY